MRILLHSNERDAVTLIESESSRAGSEMRLFIVGKNVISSVRTTVPVGQKARYKLPKLATIQPATPISIFSPIFLHEDVQEQTWHQLA